MLEMRGISNEDQEKIISLRASGMSYPEISKAIGVSTASCYRYALKHGFPPGYFNKSNVEINKITD